MYPDGYIGDGDSTSSDDGYEGDTPDVFRFLGGEVISDSADKEPARGGPRSIEGEADEESDDDSDEGTMSEESDGLTAEERLGGRTIG